MAQILAEYGPVVRVLEVVPGTGGVFDVQVNGDLVFTKTMLGRYPEPDEVMPLVREAIAGGAPNG